MIIISAQVSYAFSDGTSHKVWRARLPSASRAVGEDRRGVPVQHAVDEELRRVREDLLLPAVLVEHVVERVALLFRPVATWEKIDVPT